MNDADHLPVIPRWLPIATAICFLVSQLDQFAQLTDSQNHSHYTSGVFPILRVVIPVLLVWCILRGRFLTGTATYLVLDIGFRLLRASRILRVTGLDLGSILLLVLALVGVLYLRRLKNANVA